MGRLNIDILKFIDRRSSEWVYYDEILEGLSHSKLKIKHALRELEKENLVIWRKINGVVRVLVKDKGHDLIALQTMKDKGYITNVGDVIGEGKEAVIVLCKKDDLDLAVKFHRYHAAVFTRIKDSLSYSAIEFFKDKVRNENDISKIKSKVEFHILNKLYGRVTVPKPIFHHRHAVLMEFIGENGTAYPELRDSFIPKDEVLSEYEKALKLGFVHGDFSEYNVLSRNGEPVVIDWPQSVPVGYGKADALKKRDLVTIEKFYNSL